MEYYRRTDGRHEKENSPLPEIDLVLVRFNHVARFIVNANDGIMRAAVLLGIADGIAGGVGSVIP